MTCRTVPESDDTRIFSARVKARLRRQGAWRKIVAMRVEKAFALGNASDRMAACF
jgi:hypothetical protein